MKKFLRILSIALAVSTLAPWARADGDAKSAKVLLLQSKNKMIDAKLKQLKATEEAVNAIDLRVDVLAYKFGKALGSWKAVDIGNQLDTARAERKAKAAEVEVIRAEIKALRAEAEVLSAEVGVAPATPAPAAEAPSRPAEPLPEDVHGSY